MIINLHRFKFRTIKGLKIELTRLQAEAYWKRAFSQKRDKVDFSFPQQLKKSAQLLKDTQKKRINFLIISLDGPNFSSAFLHSPLSVPMSHVEASLATTLIILSHWCHYQCQISILSLAKFPCRPPSTQRFLPRSHNDEQVTVMSERWIWKWNFSWRKLSLARKRFREEMSNRMILDEGKNFFACLQKAFNENY